MKDGNIYLEHVLEAIHRIETYLEGIEREEFLTEPPGLIQSKTPNYLGKKW